MSRFIRYIFPVTIALLALSPLLFRNTDSRPLAAMSTFDETSLAKLLKEIRPQPSEDAFDTIPWQVSLWDARIKAAKEGKPILIWEMDGHPLGCG